MDGSILARGHCLFMSWPKYFHVLSKMNFGLSEMSWLKQQVGNGLLDQGEKVEQGRSDHGGDPTAPHVEFFSHHTQQDWQHGRLSGIKGSPHPSVPLSVTPFPFRPLLPSSGDNWVLWAGFRLCGCCVLGHSPAKVHGPGLLPYRFPRGEWNVLETEKPNINFLPSFYFIWFKIQGLWNISPLFGLRANLHFIT